MSGLRAQAVLAAGQWNAADATGLVLIDFDRRFRRRILLQTEAGQDVLLDLPQAIRLRDGDGLLADDGRIIAVRARPEDVLDIHSHDPGALLRIVWHLGNRHLPVQFLPGGLRIRADHVIEEMVAGLGGHAQPNSAPFDPEPGAYAAGPPHQHHHHDDDDHHHD